MSPANIHLPTNSNCCCQFFKHLNLDKMRKTQIKKLLSKTEKTGKKEENQQIISEVSRLIYVICLALLETRCQDSCGCVNVSLMALCHHQHLSLCRVRSRQATGYDLCPTISRHPHMCSLLLGNFLLGENHREAAETWLTAGFFFAFRTFSGFVGLMTIFHMIWWCADLIMEEKVQGPNHNLYRFLLTPCICSTWFMRMPACCSFDVILMWSESIENFLNWWTLIWTLEY